MKPFHATRAQLPTSRGTATSPTPFATRAWRTTRAAGRVQRVNHAAHFRVFVFWQGADEHGIACEDSHCEDFTISIAPLNADQRREARRMWEERLWEERGCGVCGAFSALSRVS